MKRICLLAATGLLSIGCGSGNSFEPDVHPDGYQQGVRTSPTQVVAFPSDADLPVGSLDLPEGNPETDGDKEPQTGKAVECVGGCFSLEEPNPQPGPDPQDPDPTNDCFADAETDCELCLCSFPNNPELCESFCL